MLNDTASYAVSASHAINSDYAESAGNGFGKLSMWNGGTRTISGSNYFSTQTIWGPNFPKPYLVKLMFSMSSNKDVGFMSSGSCTYNYNNVQTTKFITAVGTGSQFNASTNDFWVPAGVGCFNVTFGPYNTPPTASITDITSSMLMYPSLWN